MLGGCDYEGVVLINPESLHQGGRGNKWKVKPFHTVDLKVTQLKCSEGKVRLHEVHGYDTKTGEAAKVTGGINAEVFQRISDAIAKYADVITEVEVSSLKSLVSANPTFRAIRFDKMSLKNSGPSID
jgi:ATP-dependent DNA ligase